MSVSASDVELAILAMDAYNEGDDQLVGMTIRNNSSIGGATLVSADNSSHLLPGSASDSFYAFTCSWQGRYVFSYRGTMFPDGLADEGDVHYGWPWAAVYTTRRKATTRWSIIS